MLLRIRDSATHSVSCLWPTLERDGIATQLWQVGNVSPAHAGGRPSATPAPERDARHVRASALPRLLGQLGANLTAVIVEGWDLPWLDVLLRSTIATRVPLLLASERTWNEQSSRGLWRFLSAGLDVARLRGFAGFLTPGVLGRQFLASLGCTHERIVTGLHPVDLSFWQRACEAHRRAHHDQREPFVVLSVSTLHERSNVLDLVRGFAAFHRTHPTARLIHLGDGPLRATFQQLVQELALGAAVQLVGDATRSKRAAYYAQSDVLVHMPASEPWGQPVLEAMACQLPVIASTTVGAAADLVMQGRSGFLVYPNDRAGLVDALARTARAGEARRMGLVARTLVERFGASHVTRDFRHLLAGLAQPLPPAPSLTQVAISTLRNEYGRW